MTNILPKGAPIFSRQVGPNLLEIYEDADLGFIGYANGEREVSAVRADLVLTGLSRKFKDFIPTAEIIRLCDVVRN